MKLRKVKVVGNPGLASLTHILVDKDDYRALVSVLRAAARYVDFDDYPGDKAHRALYRAVSTFRKQEDEGKWKRS